MTDRIRIDVRVTRAEKDALTRFAANNGTTVSAIARRALNRTIGRPTPLETEEAVEVAALRRQINFLRNELAEVAAITPRSVDLEKNLNAAHETATKLLGR